MPPVLNCPRCRRTNPATASYCYFDGEALRGGQDGAAQRLPLEFVFPSNRRCGTWDEFAQACQEEWAAARQLLHGGAFSQFFANSGRADLARAADEARAHSNLDIGLTSFIAALPGARHHTPKLDINPRRLLLGAMVTGETRQVTLKVSNLGQGMLQGTVAVTEGQDWLSLAPERGVHEVPVSTAKQQVVTLHVHTRGSAAGQTYGGKLTVVTNGGVVEVPLRVDVAAQPFGRPPFQGVRTQRELAERMRGQPKAGVPLLESGEVQRWFSANGWTWPIAGPDVRGVAGVQQFFEALGLSKPPPLQLSQSSMRFEARYPETVSGQVTLQTGAKKWVYAQLHSDRPWLKVSSGSISGPQHATIPFEIDTSGWQGDGEDEGRVEVLANGGQKLHVRVQVHVDGLPSRRRGPRKAREAQPTGLLTSALATGALLLLLLRVLLIPLEVTGAAAAAQLAASRLRYPVAAETPLGQPGGWLRLPWVGIVAGSGQTVIPGELFQPGLDVGVPLAEFRHYFVSALLRHVMLWTWWLGIPLGIWLVRRRGGSLLDLIWGGIAGAVFGLIGSATLACAYLMLDLLPHLLWSVIGSPGGLGGVIGWELLAVLTWALLGAGLFAGAAVLPPLRRAVLVPCQSLLGRLFRLCGLNGLMPALSTVEAAKKVAPL